MASYGSPWKGNRRDSLDGLLVGADGNRRDLVGQWMEGESPERDDWKGGNFGVTKKTSGQGGEGGNEN